MRRLRELLSCYDEKDRVALGERYGYNVQGSQGYNYITGGGGIVFSRPLFEQLSSPGVCDCPSLSSPDDMFLGICLAQLGVNITHSPLFHQVTTLSFFSLRPYRLLIRSHLSIARNRNNVVNLFDD